MSVWNKCATPRCSRDRQHPAALCSACLTELYGYGASDPPLISRHKTLGHYREPAREASPADKTLTHLLNELHAKQDALVEEMKLLRRGLAERDEPDFDGSLVPLVDVVRDGTVQIRPPGDGRYMIPRRCRMIYDPDVRIGLQGVVDCRGYAILSLYWCPIDCSIFAGRRGLPVEWTPVKHPHDCLALDFQPFYGDFPLDVMVEIWCEPCSDAVDTAIHPSATQPSGLTPAFTPTSPHRWVATATKEPSWR